MKSKKYLFIGMSISLSVLGLTTLYCQESVHASTQKVPSSLVQPSINSENSGTWGDLTWTYRESDRRLFIEGNGTMGNPSEAPWKKHPNVQLIKFLGQEVNLPENSDYLFANLGNLEYIVTQNDFNTKNVESMHGMFKDSLKLYKIEGINNWDTSNISDMSFMFFNCTSLTNPGTLNWNTSNVNSMAFMFSNCKNLWSLNICFTYFRVTWYV